MSSLIKLKKLFKDLPVEIKGSKELEISGINNNSKRIVPGQLFIARKGLQFDGNQYIEEAINNGAVAILCDCFNPFIKITQVICAKPQQLESLLAARFYEFPSHHLRVIATTGTSGKTTVSSIIQQLLRCLHPDEPAICGLIGTVGYDTGKGTYHADHTTPDSLLLQKMLREMVTNECRYCAMEATSHGLVQARINDISIHVGVFTNLSRDHLDFHGTMQAYAEAKALLFDPHVYGEHMHTAVIYGDDPWSDFMVAKSKAKILRYGQSERCDLRLIELKVGTRGSDLLITYQGKRHLAHTSLVGEHNVMNCLGAIGALLAEGHEIEKLLEGLKKVTNIRGRLERVPTPQGFVYVDFSHKPDALEHVLKTLRRVHKDSKITCIFGCGGDRDKGKRPLMGKIASEGSDVVIVTSDNPRTEEPMAIIQEILPGIDASYKPIVEPDRALAIAKALETLQGDDVVLIAGKGHETYQLVGSRILPFDDVQVVKEWFHAHGSPSDKP